MSLSWFSKIKVPRDVGLFFALTLSLTATLQTPALLGRAGILPGGSEPYLPLVLLGVLSPLLIAYALTRKSEGKRAANALLSGLYSNTPAVGWMLLALALPGALLSMALTVRYLLTGEGPLAYPPDHLGRIAVALVISVGEEVGWRGYALPRLSKSMGLLPASLLIGAVWTLWHVPMFLGAFVPMSLLPVMLVFFSAASIVATWLYFRTNGSLLIAVLFHMGAHLNNSHLPLPSDAEPLRLHTIAWICAAALVVIDWKVWSKPSQATR